MSARPVTKPSTAAPNETPLIPPDASPIPRPAIVAVSSFGMRRVRISTAAATNTPRPRTAMEKLETGGNGVPEHSADRVPQSRYRSECEYGDQRSQHSVLEKVLTV